jgi:hypothetical protein
MGATSITAWGIARGDVDHIFKKALLATNPGALPQAAYESAPLALTIDEQEYRFCKNGDCKSPLLEAFRCANGALRRRS